MSRSKRLIEPNAIEIFGRRRLLVEGGGSAVHLAELQEVDGRSAFDGYHFERASGRGFNEDVSALQAPIWAPKTLCGRAWIMMAVTDDTLAFAFWDEPAVHAPSCKQCLRLLDRSFPSGENAPAVRILAELAAEQVVEFGSAEIRGVPGDQIEALRREGRRAVRERGFKCRSWVRDDLVVLYSDDACDAIPEDVKRQRDRDAAEVMGSVLGGKQAPRIETPWRLRWQTWDV
jgi:hypothetical protein